VTDGQGPQLVQPGAVLAPAAELAGRIAGLQAGLAALGLDAALVQQNADLFYYAGTIQQSYLYVPA
jgi:Xaa-Pro dipeptidase